jgi:hypothetical protein
VIFWCYWSGCIGVAFHLRRQFDSEASNDASVIGCLLNGAYKVQGRRSSYAKRARMVAMFALDFARSTRLFVRTPLG